MSLRLKKLSFGGPLLGLCSSSSSSSPKLESTTSTLNGIEANMKFIAPPIEAAFPSGNVPGPVMNLPTELIQMVLEYLDPFSFQSASMVCRAWRNASMSWDLNLQMVNRVTRAARLYINDEDWKEHLKTPTMDHINLLRQLLIKATFPTARGSWPGEVGNYVKVRGHNMEMSIARAGSHDYGNLVFTSKIKKKWRMDLQKDLFYGRNEKHMEGRAVECVGFAEMNDPIIGFITRSTGRGGPKKRLFIVNWQPAYMHSSRYFPREKDIVSMPLVGEHSQISKAIHLTITTSGGSEYDHASPWEYRRPGIKGVVVTYENGGQEHYNASTIKLAKLQLESGWLGQVERWLTRQNSSKDTGEKRSAEELDLIYKIPSGPPPGSSFFTPGPMPEGGPKSEFGIHSSLIAITTGNDTQLVKLINMRNYRNRSVVILVTIANEILICTRTKNERELKALYRLYPQCLDGRLGVEALTHITIAPAYRFTDAVATNSYAIAAAYSSGEVWMWELPLHECAVLTKNGTYLRDGQDPPFGPLKPKDGPIESLRHPAYYVCGTLCFSVPILFQREHTRIESETVRLILPNPTPIPETGNPSVGATKPGDEVGPMKQQFGYTFNTTHRAWLITRIDGGGIQSIAFADDGRVLFIGKGLNLWRFHIASLWTKPSKAIGFWMREVTASGVPEGARQWIS